MGEYLQKPSSWKDTDRLLYNILQQQDAILEELKTHSAALEKICAAFELLNNIPKLDAMPGITADPVIAELKNSNAALENLNNTMNVLVANVLKPPNSNFVSYKGGDTPTKGGKK